jgi:hypothetical protein
MGFEITWGDLREIVQLATYCAVLLAALKWFVFSAWN